MDELLRNFLLRITGIPVIGSIPDIYYDELIPGEPWSVPITLALQIFPEIDQDELENLLQTAPPLPIAGPNPTERLLTVISGVGATSIDFPSSWTNPLIPPHEWSRPDYIVSRIYGEQAVENVRSALRVRLQAENPTLRNALRLYRLITNVTAATAADWERPLLPSMLLLTPLYLISRILDVDSAELLEMLIASGFAAVEVEEIGFLPPAPSISAPTVHKTMEIVEEWLDIIFRIAKPFFDGVEMDEERWWTWTHFCSERKLDQAGIDAAERFINRDDRVQHIQNTRRFNPLHNIYGDYNNKNDKDIIQTFEVFAKLEEEPFMGKRLKEWAKDFGCTSEKDFRELCQMLYILGYDKEDNYQDGDLYEAVHDALLDCRPEDKKKAEEESEERQAIPARAVPKNWTELRNWNLNYKPSIVLYGGFRNIPYYEESGRRKNNQNIFNYVDLIVNNTGSDKHGPNVVSISSIAKDLGRAPDLIIVLGFINRRENNKKNCLPWILNDIAHSRFESIPFFVGGKSLASSPGVAATSWLQEIMEIIK